MTNEKQIRLVAEMDEPDYIWEFCKSMNAIVCHDLCTIAKPYLTSRDAIIPVIEKWWEAATQEKREQFIVELMSILPTGSPVMLIFVKANELAEALIRTEGKWEDEIVNIEIK